MKSNDEGLYNDAFRLANRAWSLTNLAEKLEANFSMILDSLNPEITPEAVDWYTVAETVNDMAEAELTD